MLYEIRLVLIFDKVGDIVTDLVPIIHSMKLTKCEFRVSTELFIWRFHTEFDKLDNTDARMLDSVILTSLLYTLNIL